jgi:ABC-type sugar transport system ATPase subunit
LLISHNLNDVFEVADRIAVLYLGRLVVEGDAAGFDRQNLVEYMTTGDATRPYQPPSGASAPQGASQR